MIFTQLNQKMKAMDRSLLEKIGADIEMMDKEQGIQIKLCLISSSFVFFLFFFCRLFLLFIFAGTKMSRSVSLLNFIFPLKINFQEMMNEAFKPEVHMTREINLNFQLGIIQDFNS